MSAPLIDRRSSLAELQEAAMAALSVLEAAEYETAEERPDVPGRQVALDAIAAVFTEQGGTLRQRKQLRKGASRDARCLAGILRWLGGSGTLDGLMMAQWAAESRERYSELETLALVIRAVAGSTRSPAVDAWRRTGLVGQ